MELDELKRLWQEQNDRLEASLRWNSRLLNESVLGAARVSSRRAGRGILIELLLGAVPVIWLGSFLADHIREPRFWIPAAALDVAAIAALAALVRQQVALGAIDWSGPVAEIQRRLAEVRIARTRAVRWTLWLSPLLWVPLLVVGARGLLGVDVYATLDTAWLVGNLVFGLAFLGGAIWASRRFADLPQRHPFVRQLLRDLGGRSLAEAERVLESIDRFEQAEHAP